jgi:hypothetical protein
MEFQTLEESATTLSLIVNDQPLFSARNVQKAAFQSF